MIEGLLGLGLVGLAARASHLGARPTHKTRAITPSMSDEQFLDELLARATGARQAGFDLEDGLEEMWGLPRGGREEGAACADLRAKYHSTVDMVQDARRSALLSRVGRIVHKHRCVNQPAGLVSRGTICHKVALIRSRTEYAKRQLNANVVPDFNSRCPHPPVKRVPLLPPIPLSGLRPIRGGPGRFLVAA